MKFSEIKNAVMDTVIAGKVPFVRGLHGIGKSEMMEGICDDISKYYGKKVSFHPKDVAHIKEGELTGMPITTTDPETGLLINTYTTYSVFNEVIKEAKKGIIPIIFFDEINRTDRQVFNELMPIILSKKVQDTILPKELIILTAGNPEDISEFEGATDDYSVLPMDPALKNRMFIYRLDVDPVEWLQWATKVNLDEDVITFISEYPNMLHLVSENELNPTPRGWKMFSDVLNVIKSIKGTIADNEDEVIITGSGILGKEVTLNFVRFVREAYNPILKPDDFFNVDNSTMNKNLEKLKNDTPTRQCITMSRLTDFIINNNVDDDVFKIYANCLYSVARDITMGTIIDISKRKKMTLVKLVKLDSKRMSEFQKYLI